MEISFFPIDIDYIDRGIKAEIRIFGKTDDGNKLYVFLSNIFRILENIGDYSEEQINK